MPNLATSQRKKEKIFKNIGTYSLSYGLKYGEFKFFILGEKKLKRFGGKNKI